MTTATSKLFSLLIKSPSTLISSSHYTCKVEICTLLSSPPPIQSFMSRICHSEMKIFVLGKTKHSCVIENLRYHASFAVCQHIREKCKVEKIVKIQIRRRFTVRSGRKTDEHFVCIHLVCQYVYQPRKKPQFACSKFRSLRGALNQV